MVQLLSPNCKTWNVFSIFSGESRESGLSPFPTSFQVKVTQKHELFVSTWKNVCFAPTPFEVCFQLCECVISQQNRVISFSRQWRVGNVCSAGNRRRNRSRFRWRSRAVDCRSFRRVKTVAIRPQSATCVSTFLDVYFLVSHWRHAWPKERWACIFGQHIVVWVCVCGDLRNPCEQNNWEPAVSLRCESRCCFSTFRARSNNDKIVRVRVLLCFVFYQELT